MENSFLKKLWRCPIRGGNWFLSTPSARRATTKVVQLLDCIGISIHALREEGDRQWADILSLFTTFLSTPSARRATVTQSALAGKLLISIHALREEGDVSHYRNGSGLHNFYPRPPRGGRPELLFGVWTVNGFLSTPSARRATNFGAPPSSKLVQFLSTPSARRATPLEPAVLQLPLISIHALREEGDSKNRDKISIFKQIIQHSARI